MSWIITVVVVVVVVLLVLGGLWFMIESMKWNGH